MQWPRLAVCRTADRSGRVGFALRWPKPQQRACCRPSRSQPATVNVFASCRGRWVSTPAAPAGVRGAHMLAASRSTATVALGPRRGLRRLPAATRGAQTLRRGPAAAASQPRHGPEQPDDPQGGPHAASPAGAAGERPGWTPDAAGDQGAAAAAAASGTSAGAPGEQLSAAELLAAVKQIVQEEVGSLQQELRTGLGDMFGAVAAVGLRSGQTALPAAAPVPQGVRPAAGRCSAHTRPPAA